MKLTDVRRLAMQLPEVTEEPHFRSTSYRVRGRILATVPPEGERLHVFVSEIERERALALEPAFVAKLFWGGKVWGVRIKLDRAKPQFVADLLYTAWREKAPKSLQSLPPALRGKSPALSP